ncbi:protein kinase domain-containing protein [Spirulina sp. 06S082]|uniref:protein kinase domain-containing protein n=1 Tax=Spirulina sp. 06S082 TaxID=3110248 RepID=UPI002B1F0F21|nr:protein kinase [Spirulina sp. 06S082]MEA5467874.1 protein kinase [Spirulina sp. 06S082]
MQARFSSQWKVGNTLLDLYAIENTLNKAGLATVYLARHKAWAIDVALKVLSPEFMETVGGASRCEQELETWVNLALHPHIASCYYTRPIEDNLAIVSEYVEGGSLRDWLDRDRLYRGERKGVLKRILDIAIQSAWGLHYAHERSTVHGRIKPENILIAEQGIAKITDFGWVNLGSPSAAYAAPGQLQHNRYNPSSDLWSWGLTVLEMFQGKRTWEEGSQAREALEQYQHARETETYLPAMPHGVAELLQYCWQDEHQRPPHLRFCAERLRQIYQEAIGTVYPRQEPNVSEYRADILNNRAVALIDLGRKQEAVNCWDEARRISPNHPESTYNWGLLLWRGRYTNDERLLQVLSNALDPQDDLTAYLLGWVHLERDDCQAAIASFSSLQSGNANPEGQNALALAQTRLPESKYQLLNLPGKQPVAIRPKAVNAVCFSADGRYGLSGKQDGTLELWDFKTNQNHIFAGDCQGEILSIAIAPDNRYIISLSQGQFGPILKLWSLMIGKCLCTFENINIWETSPNQPNDIPAQLADFPEVFATVDSDRQSSEDLGTVFWVGQAGESRSKRTEEPKKTSLSPNALDHKIFSDDGRYILSREGMTLTLQEVATQKILYTCLQDGTPIFLLASQRYGLSAEADPRIWDLTEGKPLRQFDNLGRVTEICLLSNGRSCLAAIEDGNLQLLSLATGRILRTIKTDRQIQSLALSADGRYALSGGSDLQLWCLKTGRCLRTFVTAEAIATIAIAPDGRYALTGGVQGTKLWQVNCYSPAPLAPFRLCRRQQGVDLLSVEEIYEQELARGSLLMEEENYPGALECLQRLRSLPGYEWEERGIFLWGSLYNHFPRRRLKGAREVLSVSPHHSRINAIALSASGEWVATAGNDKSVQLWHPRTGDILVTCQNDSLGSAVALDLSPDGRYLLIGGDGGGVQIWDLSSGQCKSRFSGNQSIPLSVSFSPDGGYAIAGCANGELLLWEVGTQRLLRRWQGHQTPIPAVGFSPDGRYLFSCETGSRNEEDAWGMEAIGNESTGTWKYWQVATGECLQAVPSGGRRLNSVRLSPEGHYGASVGSDRTVALWAVAVGRCLRVLQGHEGAVTCVDFSADGRILLSGSEDGTLRLWNVLNGECVFVFEGHRDSITAARLSADGRYAISASQDGDCKVWLLDWELAEREAIAWDEGAKPYLEAFLWLHVPPAATLPDTPPEEKSAEQRQPLPWSYLGILFLLAWSGMALAVEILKSGDLNAILLALGSMAFMGGYYTSRQMGNPSVQLGSLFGAAVLVTVGAINAPISWIPLASAILGVGFGLVLMGTIAGLFYPYPVSILPGLKACKRLKIKLGYIPTIALLLLVSGAGTQLETAIAQQWVSPELVCGLLLAILAAIGLKQFWRSRQGKKRQKAAPKEPVPQKSFSLRRPFSRLHPSSPIIPHSSFLRPSALLQKLWQNIGQGGRTALLVAAIVLSSFKWTLPSSVGITPPDLCRNPSTVSAYLYRGGNPNVLVAREFLSSLGEEKHISLLQCTLVDNSFAVARLLLDSGAKAESNRFSGRVTPLHIAVDKGSSDIVEILIAREADVNVRDEYNRTPLHWVQRVTIAQILLDAGADVNAFSRDRGTPLHWAIATNQLSLVQLFVAVGANLDAKNSEDLTPLEFAQQQDRQEIVQFLQAEAAKNSGESGDRDEI